MILPKNFYSPINTITRESWKNIGTCTIDYPEVVRGDASLVYLGKKKGQEIIVKAYSRQWILDHENIVNREVKSFMALGELGVVPSLVGTPLRSDNNNYIVMELCNCGSLDLYLKKRKRFTVNLVHEIVLFLADALSKLHGTNVLHRDINPRHVLVSLDGTGKASYKLTGLHFCKNLNFKKATSFVGTTEYIAPEASLEKPYSYPADIWSLGVTLYELALGVVSIKVDPNFRVRLKDGGNPMFPAELKVNPLLQDLICKCLIYDPKKRITIEEIKSHPFLTGPPLAQSIVVQKPADSIPEKTAKLSEEELLGMINRNFAEYMQYANGTGCHRVKLKCEVRANLHPYVFKFPTALNRGEFSEIFHCINKITNEECVLKVIDTSKIGEAKVADLILAEVETMLELAFCPFTLRIEDYFVCRNNLHLVLEYCNGGDLDEYARKLRRQNVEPPVESLKLIAWNVACGLKEMHKLQIIHRDIKPKNILVIEDPVSKALVGVKLCDYGFSKKVKEDKDFSGTTIFGSHDYLAPELYEIFKRRMLGDDEDVHYDYKIDVWSYGVLLYFAVYGRTFMEQPISRYKITEESLIIYPPVKYAPASYLSLIKRALTFNPTLRPSFEELLKEPFFNTVVLSTRTKMSPYAELSLVGVEEGVVKVFTCKKSSEICLMETAELKRTEKKQLMSEIDCMTKLRSSICIQKLYDYFIFKDAIHLVFRHYQHGSLESYTKKQSNTLTTDEQTLIAHTVIQGLNEMHSMNITHGNVQPKEILVELKENGAIKGVVIGGFGLVRVVNKEVSMLYKGPEGVLKEAKGKCSCKSDVWSYGMLLYFLVFGVHANEYPGNNAEAILRKGDIRYDMKKAGLSPGLFDMIKRCLKVNPEERPNAIELLKSPLFAKYTKSAA